MPIHIERIGRSLFTLGCGRDRTANLDVRAAPDIRVDIERYGRREVRSSYCVPCFRKMEAEGD